MNWSDIDALKKGHAADLARVTAEAKSLLPGGVPKLKISESGTWKLHFRLGGSPRQVFGKSADEVLDQLRSLVKSPPRVMG